ncbi:MAG: DUF2157 domain-containing protein [Pseudomonadota bacterium]
MDLRLALLELAAQHHLTPEEAARLARIEGEAAEPPDLARTVAFGAAILGAALGGLGIIFWVAANWDMLSRSERFALLQAVIVVMCAGAFLRPAARVPLSVLALLTIGGLFAYFGQTYQTGADPWQLFALWAALSLPLCLGVRHDALWAPWALVAMSAISLWIHAHAGHSWEVDASSLAVHLSGWSMALLLPLALSPAFGRHTGSGLASFRVSLILACVIVTITAAIGLTGKQVAPQYALGLLMLGAAGVLFSLPRFVDTFALSTVGLGLNILLVCGTANWLLRDKVGNDVGEFVLIGLVAAVMLAATVSLVMMLARAQANKGAQA